MSASQGGTPAGYFFTPPGVELENFEARANLDQAGVTPPEVVPVPAGADQDSFISGFWAGMARGLGVPNPYEQKE